MFLPASNSSKQKTSNTLQRLLFHTAAKFIPCIYHSSALYFRQLTPPLVLRIYINVAYSDVTSCYGLPLLPYVTYFLEDKQVNIMYLEKDFGVNRQAGNLL